MSSDHQRHRELIAQIFEELGRGSGSALRRSSAADLTWWLPLDPAEYSGIDDVERVLASTLVAEGGAVNAVILSPDGSTAVVEQLVRASDGTEAPATSVVVLHGGRVASGRTYLDVETAAAHEQRVRTHD